LQYESNAHTPSKGMNCDQWEVEGEQINLFLFQTL